MRATSRVVVWRPACVTGRMIPHRVIPIVWSPARQLTGSATVAPAPEASQQVERREVEGMSLARFEAEHMKAERPVVLTGAIKHWPALQLWPDLRYLLRPHAAGEDRHHNSPVDEEEDPGSVVVPVETGGDTYLAPDMHHRLMRFRDYLAALEQQGEEDIREKRLRHQTVHSNEDVVGYLAQYRLFDAVPELSKDFEIPPYCNLGRGDYYGTHAWIGPKGTVSPLHKDPYYNCLAQVVGSKYVRIYHPRFQACLYPFADFTRKNSSQVDVENPNLTHFPRFAEAPYLECILHAGELLFIPKGHWHYVRSLSRSISISFWWQ